MVDDEYIELMDFLDDYDDEPVVQGEKKCECGAHHTSDRNLHSSWCPLYYPPMGKE